MARNWRKTACLFHLAPIKILLWRFSWVPQSAKLADFEEERRAAGGLIWFLFCHWIIYRFSHSAAPAPCFPLFGAQVGPLPGLGMPGRAAPAGLAGAPAPPAPPARAAPGQGELPWAPAEHQGCSAVRKSQEEARKELWLGELCRQHRLDPCPGLCLSSSFPSGSKAFV